MALSPLNCSRCGAPLRDEPEDGLVRCRYCGQIHHFAPKPAPPPVMVMPPTGYMQTGVFRLWMVPVLVSVLGMATSVIALLLTKEPTPAAAAASGTTDPNGPGDPSQKYRAGEAVDVWWGTQWWKGSIKRVNPSGSYRIGYDGWASSWDEDVSARRLRRR